MDKLQVITIKSIDKARVTDLRLYVRNESHEDTTKYNLSECSISFLTLSRSNIKQVMTTVRKAISWRKAFYLL